MTTRKDNFREEFQKAMAWWKDQSGVTSNMIRMLAARRLSLRLAGTGQGISSSDTNHEVYSIWQEYKREAPKDCVFNWVADKLNALEEAVSW